MTTTSNTACRKVTDPFAAGTATAASLGVDVGTHVCGACHQPVVTAWNGKWHHASDAVNTVKPQPAFQGKKARGIR